MFRRSSRCARVVALALIGVAPAIARATPQYLLTPLPANAIAPNTGPYALYHHALSNAGNIAGIIFTGSSYPATFDAAYYASATNTVRDLGTLGGSLSAANAINANNVVVGVSRIKGDATGHAFSFAAGLPSAKIVDLGTLSGFTGSEAFAVNGASQIVGYASVLTSSQTANEHAFLYTGGHMTDLNPLLGTGATFSYATGINDAGLITGEVSLPAVGSIPAAAHAFLYNSTTKTNADIGSSPGITNSLGTAINNAGQVTGEAEFNGVGGGYHAFLYSNGAMVDLGTLGGLNSEGTDINSRGDVIGTSSGGSYYDDHFLYTGGAMYDLNTLVPTGYQVANAYSINDAGSILADVYTPDGGSELALLTAVPEPTMAAVVGFAALVATRRRSSR